MSSTLAFMRPPWWSSHSTVTATVDADYQASWLTDTRMGYPIRGTGTSFSATLAATSGAVDAVVIGHHNLTAGVTLGGDLTGHSISIPTLPPDGIPLNPFTLIGSPATADSFTISTTGNASTVVIGEVAAGALQTIGLPLIDSTEFEHYTKNIMPAVDVSSVLPYDKGIAQRRFSGIYVITAAEKASVLQWWQAERGGSRPSVIIPNTDENDAWFVRFAERPSFKPLVPHQDGTLLWIVSLVFDELPRSRW